MRDTAIAEKRQIVKERRPDGGTGKNALSVTVQSGRGRVGQKVGVVIPTKKSSGITPVSKPHQPVNHPRSSKPSSQARGTGQRGSEVGVTNGTAETFSTGSLRQPK